MEVLKIKTDRLLINDLKYNNWSDILEIFIDFEQSPYRNYDSSMPTSPFDVELLIKSWIKSGLYHAVRLKNNNELIGYICRHGEPVPDIGFAFKKKYQHCGYAFESLNMWLKSLPYRKYTAGTAKDNIPAVHLLEKLGFKLIGTEILSFRQDIYGNDIKFIGNIYKLEMIHLENQKNVNCSGIEFNKCNES